MILLYTPVDYPTKYNKCSILYYFTAQCVPLSGITEIPLIYFMLYYCEDDWKCQTKVC